MTNAQRAGVVGDVRDDERVHVRRQWVQLCGAFAGLALGFTCAWFELAELGRWFWGGATLVVLIPAIAAVVRGVLRGRADVDVVAVFAMAGALALGQPLAGAVVAAMLATGQGLERQAYLRARRALSALLARTPKTAHRTAGDGVVVDIPVDAVVVGDLLLVKTGEVIPADGLLASESATLDGSALTGEAMPVAAARGAQVMSGAANAGAAIMVRVTAQPADSAFAAVVRLVRSAEASKAPFVRMTSAVAPWFVAVTALVCGIAWLLSGDPERALAVLVVATPCPLIIAAPVAMLGGVSRAARLGILVKGGGPLEALANAEVVLLDKTGTVTTGKPQVASVEMLGKVSSDPMLRLAASLEQLSVHPFAPAILAAAQERGLCLAFPEQVEEEPGRGIRGRVDGVRVAVGQLAFVAPEAQHRSDVRAVTLRAEIEGAAAVYAAVDGELAGILLVHNPLRPEAPRVIDLLRRDGVRAVHLVTGDHPDVAELVGDVLGVDRVFAERSPEDKVEVVRQVKATGVTLMVGDGVNDAPALASADVSVAMGAKGAAAAAEAADIVLTSDRLDGLVTARRIARRACRIARESALAGMGMSFLAMGLAAWGLLPPVHGALLQEAIDVITILYALRALGGGVRRSPARVAKLKHLSDELTLAHRSLRPTITQLAELASQLDRLAPQDARRALCALQDKLEHELVPHEVAEQQRAYPLIREVLRPEDPTGALIRTHQEIQRLVRLYGRLTRGLSTEGPSRDELRDLRRSLYGLHAVLSLHFAQEDEIYAVMQ
ncbi:MAG: heavy metal translocating P-type ATPase [Polyangiales bacterium]